MNSFEDTFNHDRENPTDITDPTGINAWAWCCGISKESAHALACSVLTGVAGPCIDLAVDLPGPAHPGLNLLARQGDLPLDLALRQLTASLVRRQEWLRETSGDYSIETLHEAKYRGRKFRHAEQLQRLENHKSAGTSSLEPDEQLGADCQPVKESIRMEAILRPSFLVSGSLSTNLFRQLGEFHAGYGYYCGTPGPLPRSQGSRDQLLNQWQKFLLGTSVSCGHAKYRTPADIREVVLRGAFRFADDDLEFLIRERRDLLGQVLMVSSEPVDAEDQDVGAKDVRYELAEQFLKRFHRVAQQCLASRRAGVEVRRGFTAVGPLREFNRQQQGFLHELGRHPYSAFTGQAAQLPGLLAWTLALLGPKSGLDDYLLATVLPTARQLTEAALQTFELADHSSVIEERKRLAEKIIARLEKLQPCTLRELVRGFDRQNTTLFTPVIDVLVGLGIIERSDKHLRMGQIPLSKLETKKLLPPRDR